MNEEIEESLEHPKIESPEKEISKEEEPEKLQSALEAEKEETVPEPASIQSELTVEKNKEVIEEPTPRRRARVNYLELAAGSPARTPGRRGRSASIEDTNNKPKATPKPPRSARKLAMEPIVEKTSPEKVENEINKESEGEIKREICILKF